MTEYQTHAALVESLEAEVSRLRVVNAELRARGESTSLRQRADAWMAVCALLRELRPSWQEGPGSAKEQALKAIRAMAAQPIAAGQDPAEFRQFLSDVHTAAGLISHGKQSKHLGDRLSVAVMKMYTAPQPARQPLTDMQIQNIWCSARNEGNQHGPFWFARAIEKAHGIGGEA